MCLINLVYSSQPCYSIAPFSLHIPGKVKGVTQLLRYSSTRVNPSRSPSNTPPISSTLSPPLSPDRLTLGTGLSIRVQLDASGAGTGVLGHCGPLVGETQTATHPVLGTWVLELICCRVCVCVWYVWCICEMFKSGHVSRATPVHACTLLLLIHICATLKIQLSSEQAKKSGSEVGCSLNRV